MGRVWDTFRSLWGTLVTKSLPKVARRLPKGHVEILKLPRRDSFWGRFWAGPSLRGTTAAEVESIIGAKQKPIRDKIRKLLKKRQTYRERRVISSFRTLCGEPWSHWVASGTLFGAFGASWSRKVSQRLPEGSQRAPKSDPKRSFFRICVYNADSQKM